MPECELAWLSGYENSRPVRIVVGRRGCVRVRTELALRFDYGLAAPWLERAGGRLRAIAGPHVVVLDTPVETHRHRHNSGAEFDVSAGDEVPFVLTHSTSYGELPAAIDAFEALKATQQFWESWCRKCQVMNEWNDAVRRSLITLKALIYAPSGGIVAAPTTSLPERIGGTRNWDYRHCWLRDATQTLLALMNAGYREEAHAWKQWLLRAVAGSPEKTQIMYGISGERLMPECELAWLSGYENSRPVRIGYAAAVQLQLDVYGEVMDALHHGRKAELSDADVTWELERALLDHLEKIWREPDESIWEVRGPPRHFTYSKVMCWVAFDRAIKTVERFGRHGPVERWKSLRAQIHDDVCRQAFDSGKASFVQSYGSRETDASLLLIPFTGFLPPDDPRIVGTVRRIERELLDGGFVRRYRTRPELDGLPPGEACFLACSFWLVDNYTLQGRYDDARKLFEHLLAVRNDVGLMAEQYDPALKRQLGNFPQAFSHLALVNSAFNLTEQRKPARERAGT
jgi:GH15 family glucan-1,4-alpha-glucosidase